VKVLADLNIVEHRRPQDGTFTASVLGRHLDVRVATSPTVFGEMCCMRLLDTSRAVNDATIKVTTIEDPVEYVIPMINQIQIHEASGLTFAKAFARCLARTPTRSWWARSETSTPHSSPCRRLSPGTSWMTSLHTRLEGHHRSRVNDVARHQLSTMSRERILRRHFTDERADQRLREKHRQHGHHRRLRASLHGAGTGHQAQSGRATTVGSRSCDVLTASSRTTPARPLGVRWPADPR
jgi:hypothetical protein